MSTLLQSALVIGAVLVVLQLMGVEWVPYVTGAVDWTAATVRDLGGDVPDVDVDVKPDRR